MVCSDALAENCSCQNLQAVVSFTKMLADPFRNFDDIFVPSKKKKGISFPVL